MNLREAVRDLLGVREVYGAVEWPGRCPAPQHDDKSPSASFNVAKGKWYCYACGRGGRIEDLLNGMPIADPSMGDMLMETKANLAVLDARSSVIELPESLLRMYQAGPLHPYWVSRGFDEATAAFWGLGYDYVTHRVVYPMRDAVGHLLGVVSRALDDSLPKYQYPQINKSQLLFGYHCLDVGPEVVVVEGALDVIALWEAGIPAVGIYGSAMSETQAQMIARLGRREVILAFDQDRAGRNAAARALNFDLAPVVTVAQWDPAEANDVAELSAWRRREVVAHAEWAV